MESSLTSGRRQQNSMQQKMNHYHQYMEHQTQKSHQSHAEHMSFMFQQQQQQQQQQTQLGHRQMSQPKQQQRHYQTHHYHQHDNYHESEDGHNRTNGGGGGSNSSSSSGCEDDISTNGVCDDDEDVDDDNDSLEAFGANRKFNNNNSVTNRNHIHSTIRPTIQSSPMPTTQTTSSTTPRRWCGYYENSKIVHDSMASTAMMQPPQSMATMLPNGRQARFSNGSTRRRVSSLDRNGASNASRESDFCTSSSNSSNKSDVSVGGRMGNGSIVVFKNSKMPSSYRCNADNGVGESDCIEIYTDESERGQSSPSKVMSKAFKNVKEKMQQPLKQPQHFRSRSTDTDSGHSSAITLNGGASATLRKSTNSESKWKRNNIVATMEAYEPSSSNGRTIEHVYHQIEDSPRSLCEAGPSRPPPPNSMRALLMSANRNQLYRMSPSHRHMYTTRYGTQENIYEEISSEERLRLLSGGHSMMSLHQPNSVEEEFRRVHSRHRRILGELNLSVEAMLMPSTPPSESPIGDADAASTSEAAQNQNGDSQSKCLVDLVANVGPTDELLSPVSAHASNAIGDVDSGFSGSSSSGNASFLGSLRCRNGLTTRSSTPNGSASSCRSSQRSNEDPGILMISARTFAGSTHNGLTFGTTNRIRSADESGPNSICKDKASTMNKTSFWSRKGWRKFPGFSTNTNVNKTNVNNGKFNSIFSCDV